MMHHPNMHHQPMSGHPPPPQHMSGHQGMPTHHQMPPHQMHRENRVPMGPSQASGMGGHGQMGGMGTMPVPQHHAPTQRPPHPIRPMHHPSSQHHSVPPRQMGDMGSASSQRAPLTNRLLRNPPTSQPTALTQQNRLRRPYSVGGGYGSSSVPNAMPPPYAQPPPQPQTTTPQSHNGLTRPSSPKLTVPTKLKPDFVTAPAPPKTINSAPNNTLDAKEESGTVIPSGSGVGAGAATEVEDKKEKHAATGEGEARAAAPANSKEKTPMCLVNELARYNKIKHQYRLTSETGPAHKKVFTVTLRLGDTEEYTAEGSSIKRAQHAAASAALGGTRFPPPPPRALPSHAHHASHHRHAGAVMPTVELNALAMKLCQPAIYTSVPAVPRPRPRLPYRLPAPFVPPYPHATQGHTPRVLDPGSLLYRVRLSVGGRSWVGEGATPQGARHDAAARALQDMRPSSGNESDNDSGSDLLNSEVKSPVSLVHELALKRNLSVQFTVKSERGPPHMRVFITACTVGDMETEGEGNGKKVSKRRAAERMLEEMRRRWPPALLRARPPADRRRHAPTKKKPRNLIKEGGAGTGSGSEGNGSCTGGVMGLNVANGTSGGADNPISRLAVARHAARARSPQYRVLEERGAARRREFLVQCEAPPHCATGLGPNKKAAKRRAAHNVLLAMELGTNSSDQTTLSNNADVINNGTGDANKTNNIDVKRKENEANSGLANSDVRQPVPGVLMMDYHQRTGQPSQPNGVSETSATGGVTPSVGALGVSGTAAAGPGTLSPGAKDQLMYLSQLLGFTVQFSDFPKRNHGEYLSLVSLSTEPPVMCHGGGASTAHSHEQSARAALRALALMGLEAPAIGNKQSPGPGKPGAISTGSGD
ncbi:double-stranded RNA-binding protein Staufen homolog 2 isoform X2 [Pararge aegeria]|uniref:double-stranded RNA-binding protein Staufen homolog 2 isoform X2 n=1 Tax=Pararge aegeria TaxID=116150 RepID=UPI0019D12731|nr:double-stranded RNA-binding protein Staufen homolog 2 isoform X2 [Pararge aegeria]